MGGAESCYSGCFSAFRGHSGALRTASGATPDASILPSAMEDLDRKIGEDQGDAAEETLPEKDTDDTVCEVCPLLAGLPARNGATQNADELVALEGKPFAFETIAVDEPSSDEEHVSETGSGSSSTGPLPPDQEDDNGIASGGSLDLDLEEDELEIELFIEEDESKPLTANSVQPGATVDTTVGFFKVEAELGKGAQAKVVRARHEDGSRLVALKVALGRQDVAALRAEQATLSTLNHPNIVRLAEGLQSASCLVLELHTGGDLFMFARQNASPKRSVGTEVAMQDMFTQVLNGVQYLHSKNIAHKDLKLQNLLLHAAGSQRVILCDFASDQAIPGTWGYMSEEVWDGKRGIPYCVYAADLWACGCVWWGLMNGTSMPFDISRPSLAQYTLPACLDFALPDQALLMLDPLLNRRPENRDLRRAIGLAADVLALLKAMQ